MMNAQAGELRFLERTAGMFRTMYNIDEREDSTTKKVVSDRGAGGVSRIGRGWGWENYKEFIDAMERYRCGENWSVWSGMYGRICLQSSRLLRDLPAFISLRPGRLM